MIARLRYSIGALSAALVLAAGSLAPHLALGQTILATESFTGASGALNGQNTGTGWAGPWNVQNGSEDVPGYDVATANPLVYPGVSASGGYGVGGDNWQTAGRQLSTSANGPFAAYLSNGLIGQSGTNLYFSALMRQDVSTEDTISLTLHPGSLPWWVYAPGVQIGYFGGSSDSNGVRYWSLELNGTVYPTKVPVVVGQAAFLVVNIAFGATNTVSLYVNPTTTTLPSTPSAQATTTSSVAFQSLAYYGGAYAGESSIDELRFATTYSSLLTGTNAAPAAQSLFASESFSGTPGALNGQNTGMGWASAWSVQNGSQNVPGYDIATKNPVVYSGISTSGSYAVGGDNWQTAGRQLNVGASGPFAAYLDSGLIGYPGTSLLFSALMRQDIGSEDTFSLTLHPNSVPWWVNNPGVEIGYFGGASDTNGVRYWSLQLNGVVYQSKTPVVVGQTAFLVVNIAFGATNTVSLYVNPATSSLPSTPSAKATTTNPLAFQSIAFYGGSNAGESSIDEIRFAPSYSSLVAGALPPPTAPANVAALPGNAQIGLSWTASAGASEYLIYENTSTGPVLEATTAGTAYTATGLTNYQAYTYYIVAQSGSQTSTASAQVTAVPRGPAPAAQPGLGGVLAAVNDYSREWPFVDAFKTARTWIPQQQGAGWGQGPALQLDQNGWITSLQPGQYAETIMFDNALNDHADYPSGQYILLYDGSGTLSFDLQSATIVSQTPGRMVVNVPAGENGIFLIESATDPSNPIRNIRFILPGFESTYATQPFHPLFLQRLQPYKVLRFMEWMQTNGSTIQNWTDRPTPSDYTYEWRGVPLEVMIQLANALNVTPWFNIPAQATNSYMQGFATLIQQNLNSSLKFYLEYSNETWNGEFSQNAYIAAQGAALGLSNNVTQNAAYYTAYRSVQMFGIFQSVLGNNRMIRVIASQAANSWLSNQTLQFQNAFASADVLAIAPYFNCDDTATGGFGVLGDPSTAAQVAAMSIQQVEAIEMQHINNCTLQQMQSNSAVAASYGLKMVAYEGGQSLVGIGSAQNNTALTTLFAEVNRDPGQEQLYAQYFQNWVNSGGDLFMHYSDVAASTMYGNFGTLEYQDQNPTSSPKYVALQAFAQQY
jgi:hypothetical protein